MSRQNLYANLGPGGDTPPPGQNDTPREALGRLVRDTWTTWAREQPDPKPHWLTSWDNLDQEQREVDMRIGEVLTRNADTRWHQLKTELAYDAARAEQTVDEVADDEQSRRRWVQTRTRIQALRAVINRMNQIEQETD